MIKPELEPDSVEKPPFRVLRSLYLFIRMRLVQGLFVSLPFAITFWILHWLYSTLRVVIIDPIARMIITVLSGQFVTLDDKLPAWLENFGAPLLAVVIVLTVLYFLGMFFQSRIHRLFDWIFMQVPVVTNIYSAVRQVFVALGDQQNSAARFKRVVLVSFPHPGTKVPAFVTSTCVDEATGQTILCVYVPTTPVPTSGYMLMVPEDDVMELDWDLNQTLQAIVSGGISVPKVVQYFPEIQQSASGPSSIETDPDHPKP